MRMFPDDKIRHNHPFIVLEIGHVKASRLKVDIQEHIRELSATRM